MCACVGVEVGGGGLSRNTQRRRNDSYMKVKRQEGGLFDVLRGEERQSELKTSTGDFSFLSFFSEASRLVKKLLEVHVSQSNSCSSQLQHSPEEVGRYCSDCSEFI